MSDFYVQENAGTSHPRVVRRSKRLSIGRPGMGVPLQQDYAQQGRHSLADVTNLQGQRPGVGLAVLPQVPQRTRHDQTVSQAQQQRMQQQQEQQQWQQQQQHYYNNQQNIINGPAHTQELKNAPLKPYAQWQPPQADRVQDQYMEEEEPEENEAELPSTSVHQHVQAPSGYNGTALQEQQHVQSLLMSASSTVSVRQSQSSSLEAQPDNSMEEQEVEEVLPPLPAATTQKEIARVAATLLTPTDPAEEYADDIYTNLVARETSYAVHPHFMSRNQMDITHSMRSILVDWLVEVLDEYSLHQETLYLAVNYADRFLERVPVGRSKLQLVGVTAMLIAAKYNEIYPPTVNDFVYISDNTYTREEIMTLERMMLYNLKFSLSPPTPMDFTSRFAAACELDDKGKALVNFLLDTFVQTQPFVCYRPSVVAAAATSLCIRTRNPTASMLECWPEALTRSCGFDYEQAKFCMLEIHTAWRDCIGNTSKLKAVVEKYSQPACMYVATYPLPPPNPV